MSVQQQAPAFPARTPGQIYEGIAFTLCKAATLALFIQLVAGPKYILPVVALGSCVYYALALSKGQRDTRCILRLPWLIILFWGGIGIFSLYLTLSGGALPSLLLQP